jgi:hypothetical protein
VTCIHRREVPTIIYASLLLLGADASAAAQRGRPAPDTGSMPIALAEELISPQFEMIMAVAGGRQNRPRIVVGKLPSSLEQRFWSPPGSTILGSLESRGFAMTVVRSSLSADSVLAAYRRELASRGWAAPSPPFPPGGFRPDGATPGMTSRNGLQLCSDGSTLSLSATREGDETMIRATYVERIGDQCRVPQRNSFDDVWPHNPSLLNPSGSGGGNSFRCQNIMGNGVGSTTLIGQTDLEHVLDHYEKQLTDSGYVRLPTTVASRTWTRRDSAGKVSTLTLTARTAPGNGGCVGVNMEYRDGR